MFRTLSRGRGAVLLTSLAAAFAMLLPTPPAQALTLSSWVPVMLEDFNSLNTARWGAYSGQPGGNPYGMWSPRHLQVSGGVARLRGYREGSRFVTAGMMLNSLPRLYGKYTVRARFDRGVGIEQVMMLWPSGGGWPPEVDFTEGSAASSRTMATAHWGASNSQQHAFAAVNMTLWHTYGLEWSPTRLLYTIDGHAFAAMYGAAVPHVPMNLALQTHATQYVGGVSAATPREVTLYVDRVYVFRHR